MKLGFFEPIQKKTHGLMTRPAEELTRLQRTVRYALDFGRYCAAELKADRAGEMAAAMTYHTLFSLLPMVALMLAILPVFVTDTQLNKVKTEASGFIFQAFYPPSQEAGSTDPPDHTGETAGAAGGGAGDAETRSGGEGTASKEDARENYQQAQANIRQQVAEVLDKLQSINFGSIGIVGILLFIYAATKLLTTVEHSFNRIFDAPYGRPLHVRLPLYYAVITLAPLLLVGGQFLQVKIIATLHHAAQVAGLEATGGAETGVGVLGELAAALTPLVMTWILLTLMYRFLPNTRVKFASALIGAFVAAVVFILGLEAFKIYVRSAGTANIYGALALVPLFMMWLWLTWIVVLFGVEVTYTHQSMHGRRFKSLRRRQERNAVLDARWIIPIAARIAASFESGQPTRLSALRDLTGMPQRALAQLLGHLTRAGYVLNIEDADPGDPVYTLGRPPEKISIQELLNLARDAALRDQKWLALPGNPLMDTLRAAEKHAAAKYTLADAVPPTDQI